MSDELEIQSLSEEEGDPVLSISRKSNEPETNETENKIDSERDEPEIEPNYDEDDAYADFGEKPPVEDTAVSNEDVLPQKFDSDIEDMMGRFTSKKRRGNSAEDRKMDDDEKREYADAISKEAKSLLVKMEEVYKADFEAMHTKKAPALKRLKFIKEDLIHAMNKPLLLEEMLKGNLIAQIERWIRPADGGYSPLLTIREELLRLLDNHPINSKYLKQSGIVSAVQQTPLPANTLIDNTRSRILNKWKRNVVGAANYGHEQEQSDDSEFEDRHEDVTVSMVNVSSEYKDRVAQNNQYLFENVEGPSKDEVNVDEKISNRMRGPKFMRYTTKPQGVYLKVPKTVKRKGFHEPSQVTIKSAFLNQKKKK